MVFDLIRWGRIYCYTYIDILQKDLVTTFFNKIIFFLCSVVMCLLLMTLIILKNNCNTYIWIKKIQVLDLINMVTMIRV